MVQKKLPTINSAHGSETRNIINELIKLFNGMGYTYDEALKMAHDTLTEAKETNDMNKNVQQQINVLIAESGTSDAEVIQARDGHPVLNERLRFSDERLTMEKQSYKRTYEKLGSENSENIFVNRTNDERVEVFINHSEEAFQSWRISKEDYVFDSNLPELPGGDPYIIDNVRHTRLWKTKTINSDDNKIKKIGDWIQSGTNVQTDTTGDYLEMDFFGSELRINSLRAGNAGIAKITIDGKASLVNQIPLTNGEALLDMYGTGSSVNTLLATGMPNKWHTVKIEVTGRSNANASGHRIYCAFLRFNHPPLTNDDMNIQGLQFEAIPLNSGSNAFRAGTSAVELAINNTYNGNSTWSGSQHRNAYLKSDPVFFMDGEVISITTGEWQYGKELMIVQEVTLVNGNTDIADMLITFTINKNGVIVSWDLEFLKTINITNSYSAMFGTSADRIKFGGTNETHIMVGDGSQKGDIKTDHAIGYHTVNDYLIFMEALNYLSNTRNHENYDRGMFVWDRGKDAKLYIPNYKGTITTGDKLQSTFLISIKNQNNVGKITI